MMCLMIHDVLNDTQVIKAYLRLVACKNILSSWEEHEVDGKNSDNISEEHSDSPYTQKLIDDLKAIFDDKRSRLKESDPNYIGGVENLICHYNNLQQMTISTPSIASALHTFSTEGFTRRHQGSSIPVQSSALERMCHEVINLFHRDGFLS